MALTITANPPNNLMSAYVENKWQVTSDDANIVRVIADVFIDGTYEVTLEKSPDISTTNVFTFDVRSILQDYVKSPVPNWTDSSHTIVAESESDKRCSIYFYQVLDNGTTFDTSWDNGSGTGQDIISTSVYNPYNFNNMTGRHEEGLDYYNDLYKKNGTFGTASRGFKATTTFDGNSTNEVRYVKRGDFIVVNALTDGSNVNPTYYGQYLTYNSAGTQLDNVSTYLIAMATSRKLTLAIDTGFLGSNVTDVLAQIRATSTYTHLVHYEIVADCNDYLGLYWYNAAGGIDYFLFRDMNSKMYSGDSEVYEKPLDLGYNVYDFSKSVLRRDGNISRATVSEVVNRDTAEWLSELSTHGIRAWVLEGTYFIPVIIESTDVKSLDTKEGAYRVSLSLMYSNPPKTQKF